MAKKNKRKRGGGDKEIKAVEQIRKFNIACSDSESDDDSGILSSSAIISQGEKDYEKAYRTKVVPKAEWEAFTRSMRKPLKVTLRLEMNTEAGKLLAGNLHKYLRFNTVGSSFDGSSSSSSSPATGEALNFGGSSVVIELPTDKKALKNDSKLKSLNAQLAREMTLGHLSRQEVVSMLPACIAGVRPGMRVLELCACPGSKTRQMLSMLSNDVSVSNTNIPPSSSQRGGERLENGKDRSSLLVSNDSDFARMTMLSNQFEKASNGAKPNLVLTNARGDELCYMISKAERARKQQLRSTSSSSSLLFDMVFVDVPCSGDGTFRKAPELWRSWTQVKAKSLQPLQESLLTAAFEACAVGGLVVLSTCSLNPIENEQVVRNVLYRHHQKRKTLNSSKTKACKSTTLDKYDDFDIELEDALLTAQKNGCTLKLRRGLSDEKVGSSLDVDDGFEVDFSKCCRLLPQDNDTGGFFITLLRKTTPTPFTQTEGSEEKEEEEKEEDEASLDPFPEFASAGMSKEASLLALHRAGFTSAVPPKSDLVKEKQKKRSYDEVTSRSIDHTANTTTSGETDKASRVLMPKDQVLQLYEDCGFHGIESISNDEKQEFSYFLEINERLFSSEDQKTEKKSKLSKLSKSSKGKKVMLSKHGEEEYQSSIERLVYATSTSASAFVAAMPRDVIIRAGVLVAQEIDQEETGGSIKEKATSNSRDDQASCSSHYRIIPHLNILPFVASHNKIEVPMISFLSICREVLSALALETKSSLGTKSTHSFSFTSTQKQPYSVDSMATNGDRTGHGFNIQLSLSKLEQVLSQDIFERVCSKLNESAAVVFLEAYLDLNPSSSSLSQSLSSVQRGPRMSKKERQLMKKSTLNEKLTVTKEPILNNNHQKTHNHVLLPPGIPVRGKPFLLVLSKSKSTAMPGYTNIEIDSTPLMFAELFDIHFFSISYLHSMVDTMNKVIWNKEYFA